MLHLRSIQQYNTRCEILYLSEFVNIISLPGRVCNALFYLKNREQIHDFSTTLHTRSRVTIMSWLQHLNNKKCRQIHKRLHVMSKNLHYYWNSPSQESYLHV